jgi:hypothetical protein
MSVAILEKEVQTEIAYPEVPNLPHNTVGFCPLIGKKAKRWPPGMPEHVQKAIAKAVPTFGMSIQVFYPKPLRAAEPLWGRKGDPLVIGQRNGKYYLIAAWE